MKYDNEGLRLALRGIECHIDWIGADLYNANDDVSLLSAKLHLKEIRRVLTHMLQETGAEPYGWKHTNRSYKRNKGAV